MLTRDEFIAFLEKGKMAIYVYPFDVAPCRCSDVNCMGWRLVPLGDGAASPIGRRYELARA